MNRTQNDASNNFSVAAYELVAAVTFLPSRCLATIGEIFTEPLSSNERGNTRIDTQTDGLDL
jgi:hypothetical protein